MTKKKHIFVSHSSHDDAIGRRVCEKLEQEGVPCWYSSRPADLDPGVEWDDNIVKALDESAAALLLFSAASNASRWVKREMAMASKRRLPIIPLRLEPIQPSGGMEAHLITVQWTDLTPDDYDGSLVFVVQRLKQALQEAPGANPSESTPAGGWRLRNGIDKRPWKVVGSVAAAAIAFLGIGAFIVFDFDFKQPNRNCTPQKVARDGATFFELNPACPQPTSGEKAIVAKANIDAFLSSVDTVSQSQQRWTIPAFRAYEENPTPARWQTLRQEMQYLRGLITKSRDLLVGLDDDSLKKIEPEMKALVATLQERVTIINSLPEQPPSQEVVKQLSSYYSDQVVELGRILLSIKKKLEPSLPLPGGDSDGSVKLQLLRGRQAL